MRVLLSAPSSRRYEWRFRSAALGYPLIFHSLQLQFLAGRTGLRIVTIAVRPTSDAFNAPFVFSSDERVAYYFETLTKMSMQELAVGLEGFCISGINGTYSKLLLFLVPMLIALQP